jgi:hypothetical protein
MKTLIPILLIFVAIALSVLLFPLGVIVALIAKWGSLYDYFYNVAKGIDELGNAVCGNLFNLTLIKKGGYHFGLPSETISSALGKNVESGTLSVAGKILNAILNEIQANHAIISIQTNENNTQ